ncbi:crosslink repair DNA glycosylase YcaQ family protein [Microbacterium sp. NRRL B-14842]|uniref:DNA glycosylase AlkZ-like family protein n=1 Tax=Microbacterium sp. NRRL B-14842 TaxID=3162881 RepID=UPI003D28678B
MPREGITREQRFVLAADHIRDHARPDDPLAELFVRYVEGHGPAGVADFAWWSGLTLGRSREAAERAATPGDRGRGGGLRREHPRPGARRAGRPCSPSVPSTSTTSLMPTAPSCALRNTSPPSGRGRTGWSGRPWWSTAA